MSLFFEDFRPGDIQETGSLTVTKEEIVAFAKQFDPQPFHIDEDAARRSPFGGLIASGWHSAALCMRMIVSMLGPGSGSLGSPGVDELRWLKPVRPGDELSVRVEVLEAVPSRSKPDRGLVRFHYTMRNQNGEDVMTMIALGLVLRRPCQS
ncbi:MAG: MaoC family dehydratase [Acidobacteriota bacterium]